MATLLRSETRTARKHYPCGAYYWFDRSNYGKGDLEPDDWLVVEGVIASKGQILTGTDYLYQVSVDGGDFETFRARPDMNAICHKYDLYPED